VVTDPVPFTVDSAGFQNGLAGFRIEAAQDASLAILVVAGYDAQDQVRWSATFHDVSIPSQGSAHWQVHLAPTSPIASAPPPPGSERIALWHQKIGTLPACLLVEHWSDKPAPIRELLGPAGDRDCDEVPAQAECAPWIPNAVGALPTLDTANCVVPDHQTGAEVCMLGGPQCTEDPMTPREACVRLEAPYCAPSLLCQCSEAPAPADCVRTQIVQGNSSLPLVKCVIPVDDAGNRCDGSSIELDASAAVASGERECTAIRLNELAAPLGPFVDYLHLGNGKLRFGNFNAPCRVDVDWEAGTAPLVNHALVELAIDNGYHLVVPARIEIRPGCIDPQPASCQLLVTASQTETMWSCARAPVMATCTPDSATGCAGPMCNGECCGAGERCTPNGCSCGDGPACGGGDTCQAGLVMENQCGTVCCGAKTPCPV
jgi:hypothetical protein